MIMIWGSFSANSVRRLMYQNLIPRFMDSETFWLAVLLLCSFSTDKFAYRKAGARNWSHQTKFPANRTNIIWLTFWQGSLKVMNKSSTCNVNSNLVFNNVLKPLAQKCYVYIIHGMFFKHFSWMFVQQFLKATTFRTFIEHSIVTFS